MKNIKLIFAVLISSLLLTGCGLLKDTPFEGLGNIIEKPFKFVVGEHPEGPLKDFLGAMAQKDYSRAYSMMSEPAKKLIPENNLKNFEVGNGVKIQAVETKDKSKAVIYYKFANSSGQVAELIKENGAWKIQSFGPDDNQRFN